ncbi:MAG: hypothetical protein M3Q47_03215 [Actinomycetota bacterium]|nr:hypothetical protein [Actinomycetota bacterium]
MRTPVTLAAFGLGLAAVFGAAVGVGAAVGPVGPAAEESSAPAGHDPATPGAGPTADPGHEEDHG